MKKIALRICQLQAILFRHSLYKTIEIMSQLQEIQDILASVKTSSIQSDFVSYLQSTYGKNRHLSEITIPIPLVGNLDLGVLDKMYPTVEYLYFTCPGKLTGLYNIPKQIKH